MEMTANLYQTGSRIQTDRSSNRSTQPLPVLGGGGGGSGGGGGGGHRMHHQGKNTQQQRKHSKLSQVQSASAARLGSKRNLTVETTDGRLVVCGKLIGRGSFADVYKGTIDGKMCAIKLMRNALGKTDQKKIDFLEEVVVLVTLDHENIIDVLAYSTHPVPAIVSEFAERGALSDILEWALKKVKEVENKKLEDDGPSKAKQKTQSSFDEKSPYHPRNVQYNMILAVKVMLDVAKGMTYLHALQPSPLLHRDMKSGNVLVTANWTGKVADFGASKFHVTSETMTSVGTVCWMAPEVLEGSRYSGKADVYGFAITIWEAITAEQPYGIEGKRAISLARKVMKGKRPPLPETNFKGEPVHDKLIEVMTACWATEAEKRPAFPEVVKALDDISQDFEIEREMMTQKNMTEELLDLLKTDELGGDDDDEEEGEGGREVVGDEKEAGEVVVGKDATTRQAVPTMAVDSVSREKSTRLERSSTSPAPRSPSSPSGRKAHNMPAQANLFRDTSKDYSLRAVSTTSTSAMARSSPLAKVL